MPNRQRNAAGYILHQDGDEVVLPQDGPYKFSCCGQDEGGCNLVHDIYVRTDAAGRVLMRAVRNDAETARVRQLDGGGTPQPHQTHFMTDATQRTLPMTRAERRALDANESQIDPAKGLIRDGGVMRFPLMMKDASMPATGMRGSGTAADPYIISTSAATPPTPLRTRRSATSPVADAAAITLAKVETEKAIARETAAFIDSHRPGWRGSTDTIDFSASDAAYDARKLADSEAWRRQDAAEQPLGAYPMSAGIGNACTIDGQPGTLQPDGAWLVCRPTAGPTRADAMTGDARDVAYREMCDQLTNAWRG
jgi:hypothetical protein